MPYTEQELLLKIKDATKNMGIFYKCNFINYRGKTTDTNEWYSEIIAQYLCNNLNLLLCEIPCITRIASYRTKTHDGKYSKISNRTEEIIAMNMFCQSTQDNTVFNGIGSILDYQTPLKCKRSDRAGKIDLISYNKGIVHVLELKKNDSKETMLRCVLEGHTYLKTLDIEKCKKDFAPLIPNDAKFKASPLVFEGSYQYQEFIKNRPFLTQLMNLLDSQPFFLKQIASKEFMVI